MTYTKVPNSLFAPEVLQTVDRHELLLLLLLIRLSAGYHEDSCAPSIATLCEQLNLSRAHVYRARQSLERRGLLAITRERGLGCVYRVTLSSATIDPEPKPTRSRRSSTGLKSETGRKPETGLTEETGGVSDLRPGGSHIRDKRGLRSETGSILKERSKERLKETSSSTVAYVHYDDDELLLSQTDAVPQADPGRDDQAQQNDLVLRLVATGIDRDVAEDIAEQTPEVAEKSLGAAPHRKGIRNVAGWIVAECRRGGYQEPDELAQRRRRRELEQARQQARAVEAQSRETEAEREAREWGDLVATTPPEALAQALIEAQEYLAKHLPPKMAQAGLEAPFVRAQVREVLRARASPGATG